ncbi:MAG: SDR family oxidoreductase [Ardenticatenales bacterium]|jgi:NAD(P)-dependent dehydrogenase (short-subunit alcohol dehydrogenase family)|nr:SDR family oxidoreductase [Ardenticatenales bacterium]
MTLEPPLKGRIALVAGATRGAGRGIAVQLGAAGATVYCTGRTTRTHRSPLNRAETIEDTAELVTAAGGVGIAVAVDHMDAAQVKALAERIGADHAGRLDILVNDVWGGEKLIVFDEPFWRQPLSGGLQMFRNAIETHLITSWHVAPLLIASGHGLVIEVTDGQEAGYRGSLFYDLSKATVIRLALGQAEDLRPFGGTALSITPGFLRSEEMLDHFGVTEATWRAGAATDPHFAMAESPAYVGRAVAALAADPDVARWSGQALSSWQMMHVYGFTDIDGSRPDWGRYYAEVAAGKTPDAGAFR